MKINIIAVIILFGIFQITLVRIYYILADEPTGAVDTKIGYK